MTRLAIISSHPIQYNAPLFRLLSAKEDLEVRVFYSWEGTANKADPEFYEKIAWDVPLLEGYDYRFIENRSAHPGTHHFRGLDNPGMIPEIERWNAQALLIYGWPFKTHLQVLRYFHNRIPIYFRGDSTMLSGGGELRKLVRHLWLRWVYSHIDYALYPGQRSKAYFRASGLKDHQLVWVPHSVDNYRFSRTSPECDNDALDIRRNLGIPDNALVLLFAGKLVERKEPILLLRAVSAVRSSAHSLPVHLVYVGTGPLLRPLKSLAGESRFVHFLGFRNQSEMPSMYRVGDVYVLPSSTDTWGLGVNEAMASGRPAIVSDRVGCAPDLVLPGTTGDIFRSGRQEELEKIIKHYAKHPEIVRTMGLAARNTIQKWSVERAASIMSDCITQQASRGTDRRSCQRK